MKNTLAIVFVLSALGLAAQVPDAFSYQAVARDLTGSPIIAQSISIRINLNTDSLNGVTVYSETHSPTTDELGSFRLKIGTGTVQNGNFEEIGWNEHSHFMNVEMDAAGGSNYTDMGTSQLLSVPYAQYANASSFDMMQDHRLDSLDNSMSMVMQKNEEQDGRLDELLDLIELYHPFNCGDVLIDVRDGNAYSTVLVGSDCWMAEGLQYDLDASGGSYSDGTGPTHVDTVGRYYNWAGAMDIDPLFNDSMYMPVGTNRGVCPIGWHIPDNSELDDLFLNTSFNGAGELVEGGTSGMEVKLGGRRAGAGSYQNVGTLASLISQTESTSTDRGDAQIFAIGATLFVSDKDVASNVRCIKDQ